MSAKKRGLGRGLDALLSSTSHPPGLAAGSAESALATTENHVLREIPIDLIQRGKYQPRRDIEQDALQDLANSIKAQGVMQPIVVRPISDTRFEIIAGERRWRATQLAGLSEIPAVVRDVPDDAAIAMALIENIQREDLNPIEEAMALQRLQQEFELTQQEVADAVGKSRSTVTNLMRLMTLQDDVRRLLEHGDLEMGHARALLALDGPTQSQAARTVVGKALSVRQTEALVKQLQSGGPPKIGLPKVDPDIKRLQTELSQKLGARVEIKHGAKGRGKLVLSYNSLNELDGILKHIN
jgi:ParB family chromosome partitioning protein